MRILLLYTLLLVCSLNSFSNPEITTYNLSRIDDRHGLSENHVKAIIQDSWGFMWFGTQNGLNRYDGESIKCFNCFDSIANIGNNNISAIYEDVNKKLWVGTDKGIYFFDPFNERFSFCDKKTSQGVYMEDWVSDIEEDHQGNIWIVIPDQGLFRYSVEEDQLYLYDIGMKRFPDHGNPQCITVDKNGRVWIGSNGAGIYLYNSSDDSFSQFTGHSPEGNLEGKNIYTICDYGEELVVGIHEGKLKKFHKSRKTLSDVQAEDVHYKIIRDVTCFEGELWVGTQSGVYIIDELNGTEAHLKEDPMYDSSLSDNIVEKIYRDRENGIWIGTKFGGVSYLPNRGIDFNIYVPLSNDESIKGERIRELVEDSQGNIWIGTEDAGLEVFDPGAGSFRKVESGVKKSLYSGTTLGMYYDRDNNTMWVGYFKGGLDIVDISRKKVIAHYSQKDLNLNEGSIYAICQDKYGKMWIGNGWSVYVGDKKTMKFQRKEEFGLNFIYDIMEDSDGYIWVATMGDGVFKYDQKSAKVEHFQNNPGDCNSLSSNSVSSITEDSNGNIWFSTDRGGICRYNRSLNNFTSFSTKDGFPDDVAYKILDDTSGHLWFGTNKGLVKFNSGNFSVDVYSRDDGLPFNQFNYKSGFISKSGLLYFGGNGLISFDPDLIFSNNYVPPVYITSLRVFNEEVLNSPEDSIPGSSIIHSREIALPYNKSNLTIAFAALSYISPSKNKYAYCLEGIDGEWVYTKENRVSYAKLPPGEYVFRVKGSNNNDVWNEAGDSIIIKILPPWWKSHVAYWAYFLLFIGAFLSVVQIFKKKQEKKNIIKQKDFEIEKEKELYNSKLEFFTNVAHEIRTPLTLINGPLESLLDMKIADKHVGNNLNLIAQNTRQLLNLINQLLDFRKVESNAFQAKFSLINLSDMLMQTKNNFEPSASRLNKKINLFLPDQKIEIQADRDGLIKILNNLFSNAVKYSDSFLNVELYLERAFVYIRFSNDGDKIPADFQENIFVPFSQLDTGKNHNSSTGIGLSLAKSLAELHAGHIYYDPGSDLNVFVLQLPVKQNGKTVKELVPETREHEDEDGNETIFSASGKPGSERILIVEDNMEMLSFIADKLQESFNVEKAQNGQEALEILKKKTIELIVTDIMMPVMDGFELCERVKSSIEFSHIPVVLLTAKNDLRSKIVGLEKGADAYIEKPFSIKYLVAQILNLLERRNRNREVFLKKPFLPIQQISMNKADEDFLNDATRIIKDNLTETEFNVEKLADLVNMSRSSLHRKIKGLTGISSNEYIRLVRLKRAAELIQEGKYQVGEICFLVGINSPSYFIKLFQKQFGVTPKNFQSKLFPKH